LMGPSATQSTGGLPFRLDRFSGSRPPYTYFGNNFHELATNYSNLYSKTLGDYVAHGLFDSYTFNVAFFAGYTTYGATYYSDLSTYYANYSAGFSNYGLGTLRVSSGHPIFAVGTVFSY
ncbi:MAG: hypothetical protein ACP5XB_28915, partial [Isosphaeraceae bacterium]